MWNRVGSSSGRASHGVGPKDSGDPSVLCREPQCPWEHLTQQSCSQCPGCGSNHATFLEFPLSSDGIETLPCGQCHVALTPAQIGGWEIATAVFPWALACKDIPLSPKGKVLLWKIRQLILKETYPLGGHKTVKLQTPKRTPSRQFSLPSFCSPGRTWEATTKGRASVPW